VGGNLLSNVEKIEFWIYWLLLVKIFFLEKWFN
jgi:hypothetical protein